VVCLVGTAALADKLPADREKDLMRQRRDVLKALAEVRQKMYDAGRATAEDLLGPSRQLFLAEVELTEKPADVLALCDRFAPIVKEASQGIEELYKARRLPKHHYALRRAACSEDEVALARQRLKAGPSPEGEKQLKKVLLARHEAYQALLPTLPAEIAAERISYQLVMDCHRRALRAEEESTDKPAEHFRMLQQALDRLQQIEDTAKREYDAGELGQADYLTARIARLSLAIDQARGRVKDPSRSPKVQKLLAERRDAARELMQVRRQQFEAGKTEQENLLAAAALLLEAELPLAETAADRVALHRAHVEGLKKAEEMDKTQLDAGRIGRDVYEIMRAARLAAEIDLARAERTAK
jgi:hypothetical protein